MVPVSMTPSAACLLLAVALVSCNGASAYSKPLYDCLQPSNATDVRVASARTLSRLRVTHLRGARNCCHCLRNRLGLRNGGGGPPNTIGQAVVAR